MVNLDLYRVFYTVAKNGSLTKAAEELYISQPAVSQSVKQLENQLGVTLFNRTHRGMELSEEGGKRIIGKVERALRLLEEAENEVGGAVARRGAELCLSASDEVFRYILADKIAAFTKKFPAVRLKFLRLKDEKAREMLRGGKVDAVFGEQSYVCEEHIASFPSGVSLSKVYLGDKKQAERLEGALQCMKSSRGKKACDAHVCAAKLPLIALEGDDDGAAIAGGVFRLYRVGEAAETAKELAAAGAGVVLLPQIYAEKELSEGKLFVLPVAPPENPAKTLYVSINPKSEKEKLVSAFLSIAGMNRSCGE